MARNTLQRIFGWHFVTPHSWHVIWLFICNAHHIEKSVYWSKRMLRHLIESKFCAPKNRDASCLTPHAMHTVLHSGPMQILPYTRVQRSWTFSLQNIYPHKQPNNVSMKYRVAMFVQHIHSMYAESMFMQKVLSTCSETNAWWVSIGQNR